MQIVIGTGTLSGNPVAFAVYAHNQEDGARLASRSGIKDPECNIGDAAQSDTLTASPRQVFIVNGETVTPLARPETLAQEAARRDNIVTRRGRGE